MIALTTAEKAWIAVGFVGQVIFGLRFVVQWIATERKRQVVVPAVFWHMSLAGTIILLAYAIYKVDPVFIAGFSLNMLIYMRNLYFVHLHRRPAADGVAGRSQETPR